MEMQALPKAWEQVLQQGLQNTAEGNDTNVEHVFGDEVGSIANTNPQLLVAG